MSGGMLQRGRRWRRGCAVVAAAVGCAAGGCRDANSGVTNGEVFTGPIAADVAHVFAALAPTRLRVHPLTRLERDEKGKLQIACHLELADQFGHSEKWLGRVRVEVYRPSGEISGGGAASGGEIVGGSRAGAGAGGAERQDLIYTRDLTAPELNANAFDWITRTYVLLLGDLPGWVENVEKGTAREGWVSIKATFTCLNADGSERVLGATYRIVKEGN